MHFHTFSANADKKIPLFRQLADFIRVAVESGDLAPGTKLPTERSIASETSLSRGTIRAAFAALEQSGIILTRQGSGSFVSENAIAHLTTSVAIFGNSQEMLLDLKRQIDALPKTESTIFLIESLSTAPNPERFLEAFEYALVPKSQYKKIAALAGRAADKILEISAIPSDDTLQELFGLDRHARLGIICKSNVFLATVKGTLVTYGFSPDNILSFFEMDYTTSTYFPGGIDALISFSDAHIFTNERFQFRNQEFIDKGGKIILFRTRLEQDSLHAIKEAVARLHAPPLPITE